MNAKDHISDSAEIPGRICSAKSDSYSSVTLCMNYIAFEWNIYIVGMVTLSVSF